MVVPIGHSPEYNVERAVAFHLKYISIPLFGYGLYSGITQNFNEGAIYFCIGLISYYFGEWLEGIYSEGKLHERVKNIEETIKELKK